MTGQINEQSLEDRLGVLETARSWSPRVISKLESHIRSADDSSPFPHQSFHRRRRQSISSFMPRLSACLK